MRRAYRIRMTQTDTPTAVTAKQFAERLQVSLWTLYRLKAGKHLPAPLPLPGHPRWAADVVDEFVRSGRVSPQRKSA